MITRHRKTRCPHCGTEISAASSVEGEHAPKAGDVSVCYLCGGMIKFADGFLLQKLTPAEFEALDRETQNLLVKTQLMMRAVRRTFSGN